MSKNKSTLKMIRIVVFTICSLLALFFLLAFVPKIVSEITGTAPEHQGGQSWEGNVMMATFLVFLAGYVIGWWQRFWGGLLMLLAALVVAVPFIALQRNYGSLIFAIPECSAGLLYLVLFWREKWAKILDKKN